MSRAALVVYQLLLPCAVCRESTEWSSYCVSIGSNPQKHKTKLTKDKLDDGSRMKI